MDLQRARRLLGVTDATDPAQVRAAYRRMVRTTHPDVTSNPDAAARTIELRAAYELVVTSWTAATRADDASGAAPTAPSGDPAGTPLSSEPAAPVEVHRVDADTIAVGLPPDETLLVVLDVAHQLGEVTYFDPTAGLVEVVVEFLDAPTSSVLIHLQGRATGHTEAICSIEPLSGGAVPPTEAVTNLLERALTEAVEPPDR